MECVGWECGVRKVGHTVCTIVCIVSSESRDYVWSVECEVKIEKVSIL